MGLAGESASRMGAAVGMSEAALAGAGREASVAASGSAKLRAAQLSLVAAQERYNTVLADGDASVARLASTEATLIRANERVRASTPVFTPLAAQARTAETAVSRLSGRMVSMAASTAKMGLGLAVFAGAFKVVDMVKSANEFQRAMLLVQTQAGATAAEVQRMTPAILALAGPVATAPDKLATSLYHVESVGLRGAKALEAVKIAAEGAKVGNADLEETTNALTASVASGIAGVQNMQQAMGALNTVVGAGDMKLSDLNDALGSGILVVAKQFGVTLTDVGAALATFGDNNIRGADAATMLRVAINAMAKPVAGGAKQLAALGMSAHELADDMSTGGLGKALVDLKAHLGAAGITGAKVGDVLLTAFGKKAGPGVAVLVDQLTRFQTKTTDIQEGSANFGAEWAATTKTASFGFDKLGASVESAAISLYSKIGPALGTVAGWIGTTLPRAIALLQHTLQPLEQEVAGVLVPAFRVTGVVLRTVGDALGVVGRVLDQNRGIVKTVGTAVLGLWAAFKLYKIATIALTALNLGIGRLVLTANTGYVAMQRFALGETEAAGAATGLGLAAGRARLGLIGMNAGTGLAAVGVAGLTAAGLVSVSAISGQRSASGELVNAYKAQTKSTDLSASAIIRWAASSSLMRADLINVGALTEHTGVTMAALARGVSGTDAQFKAFTATIKAHHDVSTTDKASLDMLHDAFKNTAVATKSNAAATRDATAAQRAAATVIDGVTVSMKDQQTTADALNAALAELSGDSNAAALAQLALEDGLASITQQTKDAAKANKDAGTSLSESTDEGRKNLEWVHNQIDGMNSVASAQLKAGANIDQVTAKLGANEKALRVAAHSAGLSDAETNKLIKTYAAVPAEVKTTLKADSTPANPVIAKLQRDINNIRQNKVPSLTANTGPANLRIEQLQNKIDSLRDHTLYVTTVFANSGNPGTRGDQGTPHHDVGGILSRGLNWVGEKGPELVNYQTGKVYTAKQSHAMAAGPAISQTFYTQPGQSNTEIARISSSAVLFELRR
jgi:TP901 family phage tail tape measure protein